MTVRVVAAFFALSRCGYVEAHSCSTDEAERAESEVDGLHGRDGLYRWYITFQHGDDGGTAEGVSEAGARNLVDRSETLPQFAQLAAKTPEFRHFVVQHVKGDRKKIRANAANRCPTKLRAFCERKKAAGPS